MFNHQIETHWSLTRLNPSDWTSQNRLLRLDSSDWTPSNWTLQMRPIQKDSDVVWDCSVWIALRNVASCLGRVYRSVPIVSHRVIESPSAGSFVLLAFGECWSGSSDCANQDGVGDWEKERTETRPSIIFFKHSANWGTELITNHLLQHNICSVLGSAHVTVKAMCPFLLY